jgi:hypothetical protein
MKQATLGRIDEQARNEVRVGIRRWVSGTDAARWRE